MHLSPCLSLFFFFFNDTATTEIYTLSLHDALPISHAPFARPLPVGAWTEVVKVTVVIGNIPFLGAHLQRAAVNIDARARRQAFIELELELILFHLPAGTAGIERAAGREIPFRAFHLRLKAAGEYRSCFRGAGIRLDSGSDDICGSSGRGVRIG